jgi:heptosyltransferase-2
LRRWPAPNYAELVRLLSADGCELVLVGGPQDDWVRPYFSGVETLDYIGKRSLEETLRLLSECDVVVSHDTGPMHLARLVRVPLVALFGPTDPAQFVTTTDGLVTVLRGDDNLACRPCYDGREFARCTNNVCMTSITAARVADAVRRVLGAARLPSECSPVSPS